MSMGVQQRLLEKLREIAATAGKAIMAVYERDFTVEFKDDNSPLTEADRTSHEIIRDRLATLTPTLPVLSEESSPEEIRDRTDWGCFWLVDPLDGTKEFLKRNDEFTVNIALIKRNRATLGIVLAPALGISYEGALGLGAWRRSADGLSTPVRVSTARPKPRVVSSRSHPSKSLADYLKTLGPHELKTMGSSLKICLVADGQADIYPRLGPTSEWDTAAAQAILESAGGVMMDLFGRPLRYNTKEDLLNPHFLAFGDRGRDWLRAIRGD